MNGSAVGIITSGGYGHAVGKSLAFAYVEPQYAAPGTALEVAGLGERRTRRAQAIRWQQSTFTAGDLDA